MNKLFLVMAVSFAFPSFLHTQSLDIAFGGKEGSEFVRRIRLILDVIEDETDFELNLKLMTLDRCKVQLLRGEVDMDFGRTKIVYGDDERVIYISPPLMTIPYMIYSTSESINVDDIESFRHRALVIQQGDQVVMKWLEDNGFPYPDTVNDLSTAIRMLNAGRVEYFIESVIPGNLLFDETSEKTIYESEKPLFLSDVHIVLNSRHRDLEPLLSGALERLVVSGKLSAILFGSE